MTTIRVVTATGASASLVGERYGTYNGVAWRDSVDCCDSNGYGRVFLDCADEATAEYIRQEMADDDEVVSHD